MKIYGIYENDEYEECIYVGTAKEIAKEFNIKQNSLYRMVSRGDKTIQGKKNKRYLIKKIEEEQI